MSSNPFNVRAEVYRLGMNLLIMTGNHGTWFRDCDGRIAQGMAWEDPIRVVITLERPGLSMLSLGGPEERFAAKLKQAEPYTRAALAFFRASGFTVPVVSLNFTL